MLLYRSKHGGPIAHWHTLVVTHHPDSHHTRQNRALVAERGVHGFSRHARFARNRRDGCFAVALLREQPVRRLHDLAAGLFGLHLAPARVVGALAASAPGNGLLDFLHNSS